VCDGNVRYRLFIVIRLGDLDRRFDVSISAMAGLAPKLIFIPAGPQTFGDGRGREFRKT